MIPITGEIDYKVLKKHLGRFQKFYCKTTKE